MKNRSEKSISITKVVALKEKLVDITHAAIYYFASPFRTVNDEEITFISRHRA